MARKLAFALALLVLATVFTGASFANVIQITLGQSTSGSAWAGNTGAYFHNGVSGYAYQGSNAGTFTVGNVDLTGSGCNASCVLTGPATALTVTIGSDSLVGTLTLDQEALGRFLLGTYYITSSTPGFAATGYQVGQTITADISITNATHAVSSGQLQTDAVPEPGTIGLVGSGLLVAAGMLRRKIKI